MKLMIVDQRLFEQEHESN